jgi:1,2-diacylglycerol 3-beta-glucosyltransferase
MSRARRRALSVALTAAQIPSATSLAYLLTLLVAARGRKAPATTAEPGRVVVLVPAHDEGSGVRPTVASLLALDWPADRLDVVVVADNCNDDTAAQASAAGARVLERSDPDHPGKGRALAWAVGRLAAADSAPDAVVVVDADCIAEPNLLRAFAAHWTAGAGAVQARYLVANPDAAPAAAARAAAFALAADIRPLGKDRLGLSCGLLGTGMGFTWEHLCAHPWRSFGLTEDVERHLALVLAGERVAFATNTAIHSAMPESLAGAASQQSRWEAGKVALARRWTPRLIAAGIRERDPVRVHAGLELLVPPQSLLALTTAAGAMACTATGARGPRRLAFLCALAQAAFVIGGMLRMRAPAAAWRGLALAPALALRKAALVARLTAGRGPTRWERTPRDATHAV